MPKGEKLALHSLKSSKETVAQLNALIPMFIASHAKGGLHESEEKDRLTHFKQMITQTINNNSPADSSTFKFIRQVITEPTINLPRQNGPEHVDDEFGTTENVDEEKRTQRVLELIEELNYPEDVKKVLRRHTKAISAHSINMGKAKQKMDIKVSEGFVKNSKCY